MLRKIGFLSILLILCHSFADAAVSLDRTRVIFTGNDNSVSLNLSNQNKKYPFLAQAWLSNQQGEKITQPFAVLPPLQRIEAGDNSLVRIIKTNGFEKLPTDKESVFYFNLREIPPRMDKANILQIAVQTQIKLFYRPTSLIEKSKKSWQHQLTVSQQGNQLQLKNPSAFYTTILNITDEKGYTVPNFKSVMVAPFSSASLPINITGKSSILLTYINDYGGNKTMVYVCHQQHCQFNREK